MRSMMMFCTGFSGFGWELRIYTYEGRRQGYLEEVTVGDDDVGAVKRELVGLLHLALDEPHGQGLLELIHDAGLLYVNREVALVLLPKSDLAQAIVLDEHAHL